MRNRFESRERLCNGNGIGFNPAGGAGGINPLQPNGEIKEAPGAQGILAIRGIMNGVNAGPARWTLEEAKHWAQRPTP